MQKWYSCKISAFFSKLIIFNDLTGISVEFHNNLKIRSRILIISSNIIPNFLKIVSNPINLLRIFRKIFFSFFEAGRHIISVKPFKFFFFLKILTNAYKIYHKELNIFMAFLPNFLIGSFYEFSI